MPLRSVSCQLVHDARCVSQFYAEAGSAAALPSVTSLKTGTLAIGPFIFLGSVTLYILRHLVTGPSSLKGDAAAAGAGGIADGVGVADGRMNIFRRYRQDLCHLHGYGHTGFVQATDSRIIMLHRVIGLV